MKNCTRCGKPTSVRERGLVKGLCGACRRDDGARRIAERAESEEEHKRQLLDSLGSPDTETMLHTLEEIKNERSGDKGTTPHVSDVMRGDSSLRVHEASREALEAQGHETNQYEVDDSKSDREVLVEILQALERQQKFFDETKKGIGRTHQLLVVLAALLVLSLLLG